MTSELLEVINLSVSKQSRASMIKYLTLAGINDWNDFDSVHIDRFSMLVKENVTENTAHTLFSFLKAFLNKHEDKVELPNNWKKRLKAKAVKPMKTYLNAKEVEAFGKAYVESDRERTVRDGFYISCKTGLRHSDLIKLTPSNFIPHPNGTGYIINYVSQKTKAQASIPCGEPTKRRVEWITEHGVPVSLTYYDKMVKELAKRAGIKTEVTVFMNGVESTGPKYKFLASHSARISFATILADFGTNVLDIMRLCGHKSTVTTLGYIVSKNVVVNAKASNFLNT